MIGALLWASLAWAQDLAASFAGEIDHVLLGPIDPGPAYTVELWVRLDAFEDETLICTSDATWVANLCVQYRGDTWVVKVDDNDPLEAETCTDAEPHVCVTDPRGPDPTVVHVAVTVDPAELVLWVDGVAVGSAPTGQATSFAGYEWALGIDAEPAISPFPAGWNNDGLHGLADEVRIWGHVRTAEAMACTRAWALTGREDGLVALWSLDEADGAGVTPDATPNGHDGLLQGAAALVASPFGLARSTGGDVPCLDFDLDGLTPEQGDCDDEDPLRHPDADEVLDDGVDQDCDGHDTTTRLRGGLAGCDCDGGGAAAGWPALLLLVAFVSPWRSAAGRARR